MFEPVKLKNALHPWVLLPTALLAALFTYCARYMPINYWHHSKFGHENDVFFNDYFPLIHLFQHLVPNSGAAPINESNYLAFSVWAVVFSVLAVWMLFSLTFRLKSKLHQVMGFLLVASCVPFIWINSFALNQALLVFSAFLLLFFLSSNLRDRILPSILFFSIVSFFSLGSSIFGMAVVLAMFVGNIGHKKGLLSSVLALFIAIGGLLLVSDHLSATLSKYLTNGAELYTLVDGVFGPGQDVSFLSILKSFLFHTHPVLLVGLITAGIYLKGKNNTLLLATGTLSIGALVIAFFFKEITVFDNYSLLFIAPVLVPVTLAVGSDFISRMPRSKPIVYLLLASSSVYGIGTWLSPNPLNYMSLSLPYQSFQTRAAKGNIDYLNVSGIQALKSLEEYKEPFDTLTTNFYYNLPIEGVQAELANYFKRDQKSHDVGIYILKNIPFELKRSAAYPPSESLTIANINYKGVTFATICRPSLGIRKAFKNLWKLKPGASVVAFRKLTERFPHHPEAWYGYAQSQFMFSTWDDALQATQIGLSTFPDHIDMLFLQGQIYQKQGKDQEALAKWDRCLSIYKGYGKAWWNKGEYYMRKNDFKEARNQLINAKYCEGPYKKVAIKNIQALDSIDAKPEFKNGIEAYYIEQINALQTQEYSDESKSEAESLLQEMAFYIDLDSTNAQLRSHIGLIKLMIGNYPGASLAFEKAIEMNPNFPTMREYLAIARNSWGAEKYQEDSLQAAIFHFKYALDYAPEDYNAKTNLSVSYTDWAVDEIELQNYDRAFKLLREAIYYNGENPDAFYEMGNLKMAIEQPDSAEIAFNQAFMVDNTNLRAIERLIELYRSKGDDYKADIYAKRLKAAQPKQP